ncbi:alkylated DNA repair dioxygenase [Phenylobacterium sp. Root77]|uniref:alpha-ketoglutarate-dependent dioxygenase AlkB n=1 Tax=unclassified Phenylobacterium TaxID=2640670 RepID=UPI0006F50F3F|nr:MULTISPECIES: alpha-ketoglutarate-dependent dioxygenase AlkB [unclassified Phenylobacterium]KQW69111.1 alkylated DNA repair dioxygenase [Phenylobacterium sp. Root1277]KQW95522.1 alkylated DNA repair dioxygenase [Phenylobacterium sp. Root1290]KRC41312.1 alkylated DNA repair dioxygenase [Phenylobacterium sp. Root77]
MSLSTTTGFRLLPGRLSPQAQAELLDEVMARVAEAPLVHQATPGGKAMSVGMTSFGELGWTTDARGYRYEPRHPTTGRFWPSIPTILTELWRELADPDVPPDACLINFYNAQAKMGLHQDKDEADLRFPVLSVSLGDTAVFRIGGRQRSDPTSSVRLSSGDVCLLAGEARLFHHGVDRILPGSSRLIPGGGRINLTLRRAAPAQ